MFPIHFNSPYRKKDGSLTTMEKALGGAGADLDLVDLDDVAITNPADGDGLIFDVSDGKWKNVPIMTKEQWKKNGAYNLAYHKFTTQTLNGVTFTVNADKSITLNNTATAAISAHFLITTNVSEVGLKEGETYKLVGLTPTTPECSLKVNCQYNSANHVAEDTGNGAIFTFTGTSYADFTYDFYLIIPNGTAFNNNTIYPMITTDLNATYADYVPYAKTNRQLTEVKTITGVSVTSTAYTLEAATVRRVGNIIQLYFSINIPNGLAAGENADGTVSGLPLPLMNCQGDTYTGTRVVGWLIQPDGTVRIRAVDALLSNEYVAIAATYICE